MRIDVSKILALFGDCEYRFYLSTIEQIPYKPNKWLKIGKAVHEAISEYYKTANAPDLRKNQLVLKRYLMGLLSPLIDKYADEETREPVRHNMTGLIWFEMQRLATYFPSHPDDSELLPILNEEKIVVKVGNDELVGVIDIGFQQGQMVDLYDWKTSNTDDSNMQYEIQLRFYQYLYEQTHQTHVRLLGNVFTKTKHVVTFDRFRDNENFVFDMVRDYKAKIKSGEFRQNGEFCEYCSYLDLCSGI